MKRLVLLLAAIAFIAPNYACSGHAHTHDNQSSGQVQAEIHTMLNVQGSCGMCKTRIEKAAKSVDGVTSASWDRETQVLYLSFVLEKTSFETSLDAISKAVAKVGHDTEKDKADDATYNALPGCCKYRK